MAVAEAREHRDRDENVIRDRGFESLHHLAFTCLYKRPR